MIARLIARARGLMAPPDAVPDGRERDIMYVTFHTEDDYYREQVKPLVASLERFGLPYRVYEEKNSGDWKKNCWRKTYIIRRALHEYGRRVVWLDADSEIVRPPSLLPQVDADFAGHFRFGWMVLGGALMFDDTPGARHLLDLWDESLDARLKSDQDALGIAVHLGMRHGVRAAQLPAEYCAILEFMKVSDPVIAERMAHRRGKTAVRTDRGG